MIINKTEYIPALKFNKLTGYYDWLIRFFLKEHQWKAKLIENIHNSEPENILDIGCGTATLTIMLKKEFAQARVTGIDGDENILKIASKKVKSLDLNIELKQALSYKLPYNDNSFDIVVSSLMLHHMTDENKIKTIREVHRVLRQKGHWGKPTRYYIRILFYLVQLLDGFETTKSNVKGRLPEFLINSGMATVEEPQRISTILGSISIYSALKK